MSNELIPEYAVSHAKPNAFCDVYERKEELRHQTHYCPGCGHGNVHKMLALAIDELGIQDRTILISPVGCSVFAYYYFDVGNVQAAHGRAPAVATGVKRSRPESIVIGYQGDGDLSAIGSAEILHAANRGEHITVIFVNNAIYSMTGGQAAPTTLIGQKSTTTPGGRNAETEGYPLHVCELLATLQAPVYIERVGLGDNKQIAQAARAIKRAVENQVRGLGFSLIEVLSPCPTIWKMSPVEAQHWVRDVMEKTYPLGVFRDRTREAVSRPLPEPAPALAQIPKILGVDAESLPEQVVEKLDSTGLLERFVSGHDFNRAANAAIPARALQVAEELALSGILEGSVSGHDFSRAANAAKSARALAPAECLSGLVAGTEPFSAACEADTPATKREAAEVNLGVRVAGFGGQGVLLLGEVLAEAGLDAGLEVSWLPSYGPEMRSGTSNCHVRLSSQTIDSPLVTAPDVLVAMNEPSLRKFDASVPPGGWVIFNGDAFPEDCERPDVHVLALPFTRIADELGDARACNMVMLGALLEIVNALPQASIDAALRRLVKHQKWVDLDERALARGRELYRNSIRESTRELAYES